MTWLRSSTKAVSVSINELSQIKCSSCGGSSKITCFFASRATSILIIRQRRIPIILMVTLSCQCKLKSWPLWTYRTRSRLVWRKSFALIFHQCSSCMTLRSITIKSTCCRKSQSRTRINSSIISLFCVQRIHKRRFIRMVIMWNKSLRKKQQWRRVRRK